MKQIIITEYGSPEVLKLVEAEKPEPKADEVLVKIEVAGINFSDILRRRNTYSLPSPLPYVLGQEAVGEITALGENADHKSLHVGDRVLAILPGGGGYAEYVAADARYCIPLPPEIDAAEATAIFVQGSTAYLILNQIAGEIGGKSILIHAAGGGVGSILVQLAKLLGAEKVIAAGSSEEKLTAARNFGADAGINYSQPDWTDKVIEANDGKKVDLILEMVGGGIFQQSFKCLKEGGTMIVYGAASGEKGFIHSEHFIDQSQSLLSFNLGYFIRKKMDVWQKAMGSIIELMAKNKLKISVKDVFSLEEVKAAHEKIEARQTTGKVVLKP